jgi:hypothetical protein
MSTQEGRFDLVTYTSKAWFKPIEPLGDMTFVLLNIFKLIKLLLKDEVR